MANTIVVNTIQDGPRNLIVLASIVGDGSGDETNTILVDASTFDPPFTSASLVCVESNLGGFTARLLFDASTDVLATALSDGYSEFEGESFGGFSNSGMAGATGDILLTTVGLGAAEAGTILIHLQKGG